MTSLFFWTSSIFVVAPFVLFANKFQKFIAIMMMSCVTGFLWSITTLTYEVFK